MTKKRAILYFDGALTPDARLGVGTTMLLVKSPGTSESRGETASRTLYTDITSGTCLYAGLILGVERAIALEVTHLLVQGDSRRIINQVNKTWKCDDRLLIPFRDTVREYLQRFTEWQLKYTATNLATPECRSALDAAIRLSQPIIV